MLGMDSGISGVFFFFVKQKTAYDVESRDWSSVVCSSDLTTLGNSVYLSYCSPLVNLSKSRHSSLISLINKIFLSTELLFTGFYCFAHHSV